MIRNAVRWVVVALITASMLIVAAMMLSRLAADSQPPASVDVQVPASNMALPLDASGVGMQIIPEAVLSVKLSPYPPQGNAPSTLTLVALDPKTQAVKLITPTLEIAPLADVDGVTFAMKKDAAGSMTAGGVFFPQAGEYRLRIHIDLGTAEPYSMLIVVNAG